MGNKSCSDRAGWIPILRGLQDWAEAQNRKTQDAVRIDVLWGTGPCRAIRSLLRILRHATAVEQPREGSDRSPFNGLYVDVAYYGVMFVAAWYGNAGGEMAANYRAGRPHTNSIHREMSRRLGGPKESSPGRSEKFNGDAQNAVLSALGA